ncbi:nitroreductase family protein [Planococcus sp. APC 3900]|uniref:nitroreductase family protein n=1 Tax=Planococcus sp. APC 3900 TaxID=3035191 RepID=UPI0025B61FDD|nr:nitroreductase family protein [Planococcus sp. APC 3900]MDN3437299.1 nitroreductase family protein [Planococcus sp. APC 3900]
MQKLKVTNDFDQIVNGRRSIKLYDPTVKISREEMSEIIAQASRAPSSVNLQPWRFLVIDSEEGKEKLLPLASFNSNQVKTSSAVIAIFGDLNNFDYAEEIFGKAVELGYMPAEVKEMQLNYFTPLFEEISKEQMKDTVTLDSGLVAMQLMLVARSYGYDTNPIGGYDKERIAEVFGMDKERYVPVMLISIGKGVNEGYPSYRLPVEAITTWS